jgi:tetratricopeptide (TPR) repeat protein
MSRTAGYGQSFAQKYLSEGKLDEALLETDKAIELDDEDPEPVLDRAQVLLAMNRYEETVTAVQRAIELDRTAKIVDDMVVDDTLFSALVGWAQSLAAADPDKAVAVMARYLKIFPPGIHQPEAEEWTRRFRGHVETWVKAR